MPFPSDPDKIVFKNYIYPGGLTTSDIYSYYMKNKKQILEYSNMKKVVLFMAFDPDKPLVIVRNRSDKTPIYLNQNNYEAILSGYTLSITMETEQITEYMVLDIDYNGTPIESHMKKAAADVEISFKNDPLVEKTIITNSSTGYHVYGFFRRKMNIDTARNRMEKIIRQFSTRYNIGRSSKNSGVVLDISPMYKRGSIVIPNALTREGLKCSVITNIRTFNRRVALIK